MDAEQVVNQFIEAIGRKDLAAAMASSPTTATTTTSRSVT